MNRMFDPWEDARLIAERLRAPGSRLLIFLGAEAWCAKCRSLRPQIDALSSTAPANETWIWLDLEDHAEFLGDYLPEDLPQLIVYEGMVVTACKALSLSQTALEESLRRQPAVTPLQADPGILANLLREDWVT